MQACPFCHSVLTSSSSSSSSVRCTHLSMLSSQVQQSPLLLSAHFHDQSMVSPSSEGSCSCNAGSIRKSSNCVSNPSSNVLLLNNKQINDHVLHLFTSCNDVTKCLGACRVSSLPDVQMHQHQFSPFGSCGNASYNFTSSLNGHSSTMCNSRFLFSDEFLDKMKQTLSLSGWYWTKLSWQEAELLLQSARIGTFLVRDSSDPHHIFSLSVQTEKGPTSVRIHYSNGKFRLSGETNVKSSLPEFPSVVNLVQYYVESNDDDHHDDDHDQRSNSHVWLDSCGKVYSPICIRRPLLKRVPTLKHQSRKTANRHFPRRSLEELLPPQLLNFLDQYPYWC